jgi:hypothetical protein
VKHLCAIAQFELEDGLALPDEDKAKWVEKLLGEAEVDIYQTGFKLTPELAKRLIKIAGDQELTRAVRYAPDKSGPHDWGCDELLSLEEIVLECPHTRSQLCEWLPEESLLEIGQELLEILKPEQIAEAIEA